jgi:hypothetical protein
MSRASDSARLVALALLNFADDEGYFYADAAAVRSFCRPFDDDSMITRASLETLMRIEYIEIREHAERGPIGRIVKFSKHQKVDRANTSKIKEYFFKCQSSNVRRLFDDQSPLEQGTGNREQGSINSIAHSCSQDIDSGFPRCYEAYPRHVGKGAALTAYGRAIVRLGKNAEFDGDPHDFIYQRIMTFNAVYKRIKKQKQFIPHMATWLNQDRFMDDPSEWAVTEEHRESKSQERINTNFSSLAAGVAISDAIANGGIPRTAGRDEAGSMPNAASASAALVAAIDGSNAGALHVPASRNASHGGEPEILPPRASAKGV